MTSNNSSNFMEKILVAFVKINLSKSFRVTAEVK